MLELAVGVVGEGAVAVVRDSTQRTACVHRQAVRVGGVEVAVVGAQCNAWTVFIRAAADRYGNRRIVLSRDGHRRGLRAARAAVVGNGVGERVGRGLARSEVLELTIGAVAEGTIAVVRDSTQRSARVHREGMRVARVHIAVVGAQCNAWTVFVRTAADRYGNR